MPAKEQEPVIKHFLLTGKIEGYSYLVLLFIAMPLKYIWDMPIYVRIAGSIHGFLFVLFIFTIIRMYMAGKFGIKGSVLSFILSLIPFGTFFLEKLIQPTPNK